VKAGSTLLASFGFVCMHLHIELEKGNIKVEKREEKEHRTMLITTK